MDSNRSAEGRGWHGSEASRAASEAASPTKASSRGVRKVAVRLATLCASTAFALLMLEIAARSLWTLPMPMADIRNAGLYTQTPRGCGLTPGFRHVFSLLADPGGYPVSINSLGMRGTEIKPKQPGEQRILVLGDSLPFGYGVSDEETMCHRLQTRMGDAGHRIVVGNGGIPGLGNIESANRLLDLAPAFEPDAVLMCIYLGNDALDNRIREVEVVGGLRFTGAWAQLMRTSWRARMAARFKSCLWIETMLIERLPDASLLADAIRLAQQDRSLIGFPGNNPPDSQSYAGLFLDTVDEERGWPAEAPPALPRALDDFRNALLAAKEGARGKPIAAVILPTLHHLDDENYKSGLAMAGLEEAGFQRGRIQGRLKRLCADIGVPCIDITPHLEAQVEHSALFLQDRGHLSPLGNDEVAKLLADASAQLLRL